MTRYRKAAKQNQQEEANTPLKRSRQSEGLEGSKANPTVQRQDQTSSQAGKILDLQRTVGNKAVSRYLNSTPASIQRDIMPASDREKEMAGSPDVTRIPAIGPAPGAAVPMPMPNQANMPSPGSTSKGPHGKMGSVVPHSVGNDPGTMRGIASNKNMGSTIAPPGLGTNNAPAGEKVKPSQSKVILGAAGATQEEESASPPAADQSQVPEEEPGA